MIRVGLLDRIIRLLFGPSAEERIQEDEGIQITPIFFRKIIKSKHYCSGKERAYFGFTFESNNTDRGNWLIRKISDFAETEGCSESRRQWGYDDFSESTSDPPFTWPDFEVGEE